MKYEMKNGKVVYHDPKGRTVEVCNFEARIVEELRVIDGAKVTRSYVIHGQRLHKPGGADGENEYLDLPPCTVDAEKFAELNWVTPAWGSNAIIFPVPGAKEVLRTIVQLESDPEITSVYAHTGWAKIDGRWTYLSAGAAITANGRTTSILTQLPPEVARINFPSKSSKAEIAAGVRASLNLTDVAPPEIAWMLLGAAYRAAIGKADFCVHLTGRTGTFKSELAALIQSHFGECTAREMPGSWSSTANALEALAYRAKDAIMVVDDFIPMGTSWQIKSFQKTADQLIRAQGNQAGRSRLTDASRMQQTMYPRGIILSTGEDTPEGHSVRARMLIAETTPGDIAPESLSKAQQSRGLYQHAMAAFIGWLAKDLPEHRQQATRMATEIRDANLRIGHARTAPMIGELLAGVTMFLLFAADEGYISDGEANPIFNAAEEALKSLGHRQIEYLQSADPAEQFIGILRAIFAANAGHLKGIHGGIPRKCQLLGWTTVGDSPSDMEFKPHGPRLGWADEGTGTAFLEATVAYDTIRRHSRGAITITRQTLYKRLREAGHLKQVDDARQRNTVRVTCENATRTVLAMSLNALTEGEEK